MNSKDVCLRLLSAEAEKSIDQIIESVPEMKNSKNWKPLDGRETNFNVTGNQASDGGKALTELMTNMVDAVLLKHAYEKGIDPKDPKKAPSTMYKAVDVLIKNMRGGKLVNLKLPASAVDRRFTGRFGKSGWKHSAERMAASNRGTGR